MIRSKESLSAVPSSPGRSCAARSSSPCRRSVRATAWACSSRARARALPDRRNARPSAWKGSAARRDVEATSAHVSSIFFASQARARRAGLGGQRSKGRCGPVRASRDNTPLSVCSMAIFIFSESPDCLPNGACVGVTRGVPCERWQVSALGGLPISYLLQGPCVGVSRGASLKSRSLARECIVPTMPPARAAALSHTLGCHPAGYPAASLCNTMVQVTATLDRDRLQHNEQTSTASTLRVAASWPFCAPESPHRRRGAGSVRLRISRPAETTDTSPCRCRSSRPY